MVFNHICALAAKHTARTDQRRAELSDAGSVWQYAAQVRQRFHALLGMPECDRTPLNARTTGRLERDGYTVENVVFESRPSFYVTGNLYLPKGVTGPVPAILHPLGHTAISKLSPNYQRVSIMLALNGFAVLAYDPIGQGERVQYWDPHTKRPITPPKPESVAVAEHEYAGIQSLLTGVSMGGLMVWDAMRALDYLCSRPEVDADRIGCTGVSGGGVLTAYTTLLDERIKVAAPICYITTRRHWLLRNEYADAEQVQDDVVSEGIDHSDLCIGAAPRPVLIGTTTEDFFPMEGAVESAERARRAYSLLGVPQRVDIVIAEGPHGYKPAHRVAMAKWFRRWLYAEDDPECVEISDDLPVEEPEALTAAPQGQVYYLGSRSVFSFTRNAAAKLAKTRRQWFAPVSAATVEAAQRELRRELQQLLRIELPQHPPVWQTLSVTHLCDGSTCTQLTYQPEEGITIPAVLVQRPGHVTHHSVHVSEQAAPALLYEACQRDPQANLLVVEMRGLGSTLSAPPKMAVPYKRIGTEGYHLYNYGMVGRNLLGCRVLDILAGVNLLRSVCNTESVWLTGHDLGALASLMAAALDPHIARASLRSMLGSYYTLATSEFYDQPAGVIVPGILKTCDLPEVAACVAPRELELVNPVDEKKRVWFADQTGDVYKVTQQVYGLMGAGERFRIACP